MKWPGFEPNNSKNLSSCIYIYIQLHFNLHTAISLNFIGRNSKIYLSLYINNAFYCCVFLRSCITICNSIFIHKKMREYIYFVNNKVRYICESIKKIQEKTQYKLAKVITGETWMKCRGNRQATDVIKVNKPQSTTNIGHLQVKHFIRFKSESNDWNVSFLTF